MEGQTWYHEQNSFTASEALVPLSWNVKNCEVSVDSVLKSE